VEAVQTEWPSNLPLFVRISATDWADGGWNAEESVALSKILKERCGFNRCFFRRFGFAKKFCRTQLPSSVCRPNKIQAGIMTEQLV
jgi:hypothetical protein